MEQLRRAIAVIVGLVCAGLGYAWLAGDLRDEARRRDVGDLTGMPAPPTTARLTVGTTQTPAPLQALPPVPHLRVSFRGDLLTVIAYRVPLREVLSAITRSVGVTFAFGDDAVEQLSIELGPRPVKEVISGLLDRASYGHAFVESAGDAGHSQLTRVFLVKRGTATDSALRGATQVVLAHPAVPVLGKPSEQASPPDEAAMQQQHAVDALFDACKAESQACDTS